MEYDRYQKFCQETSQMLGKAKDATFEFMDSVMTTRNANCQVPQQIEQKVLVVLDSKYGNGSWVNQTGEIPVSKLMRIRSNCCLWSKPKSYSGMGRPRKHERK